MMFTYKARDLQGRLVSGTMDTENEQGVASSLDALGYSVVEVAQAGAAAIPSLAEFAERFRGIDKQQVIFFTRQLATMMRSGMPLLPSLQTICEQTQNKKLRILLEDVRRQVGEGMSFSDALSKYPNVFSDLFVSMIRVGEAGGVMDQVLDRLALLGTQEMEIYSRIRSAMTYPIVLVIFSFLIVNFILVGVLPKFVMVFNASNAPLPIPTKIILGLSWGLRNYWWVLAIAAAAAFYSFQARIKTEDGKFRFHQFLLRVPVFGELYAKVQISRFARTLSTLTRSGIPILQALTVVEKTIHNVVLQRAIQNIRGAITSGSSLVEPFRESGLFSPMVVQMISIGEKSGKIDEMFEEICAFYDPEIEYTIKNLTSLLEPFMLLVMGLMVAFIALSVLLPIFNLIKAFRG